MYAFALVCLFVFRERIFEKLIREKLTAADIIHSSDKI